MTKVFTIRENGNGRYHMNKFGMDVGGTNGNEPFVIQIENSGGTVIGISEPITSGQLNISADGRDYKNNEYRITDFLRSPAAQRLKWKTKPSV